MDYNWRRWAAPTTLCLALGGTAQAQDKAQYWLFRPTPESLMRDMTTDRPDLTESPFTVDAGHIQVETNIFGYARSRPDSDGEFTKSFEYTTTNVRIGLTNFAELNVVFAPHAVVKSHSPDPEVGVTRQSGSGGVDLRLKINLWGNDSFQKPGATALAILPFLTIPTGWENGISPPGVEGGLIVPFSIKLTDKWGLGLSGGFHVSCATISPSRARGQARTRSGSAQPLLGMSGPRNSAPIMKYQDASTLVIRAAILAFWAPASRTRSQKTFSSMLA